ncbi:VQ motif-containing protein 20 [Glycine max]|nr:hypothetical protein GYH30_017862 [Glycine max]KAH1241217.1 VQ motif-containing protein 20 [Glycine max]
MSPSQFHAKKQTTSTTNNNNINGLLSPSLRINKESHLIKKSSSTSPSSSSTSSSSLVNSAMTQAMPVSLYKQTPPQQQQCHPVIIYTHSPKVIHTQPKDFMSLVQKLTGLSRSDEKEDEDGGNPTPQQPSNQKFGGDVAVAVGDKESGRKNEDNETSSVITTEENYCSSVGENQVNSCFMTGEPSMLEPRLNPYVTNLPVLAPSSAEFACSSQPFLNYTDSLFFSHNMRNSIPSSVTLEGMKEFREH